MDKKKILTFENLQKLFLIMVIGAIFGFIYETIFYRIDLGYFVKRGTTFGPWIPIYAFGSALLLLNIKIKDKPFLVLLSGTILTGILEYLTGYILFTFFNLRLWDYNTEIWNFGNINGYICLRSVLFFGISGLVLIYAILPIVEKIQKKTSKKVFAIISIVPFTLFALDMLLNSIRNILR